MPFTPLIAAPAAYPFPAAPADWTDPADADEWRDPTSPRPAHRFRYFDGHGAPLVTDPARTTPSTMPVLPPTRISPSGTEEDEEASQSTRLLILSEDIARPRARSTAPFTQGAAGIWKGRTASAAYLQSHSLHDARKASRTRNGGISFLKSMLGAGSRRTSSETGPPPTPGGDDEALPATAPPSRGWNNRKHKSRKLVVFEIVAGKCRKHLLQTPELLRLIHLHNKRAKVEDTMSGSVKLRDLRQICTFSLSGHRPSIEPRRNSVLVNLPKIRCVMLFDKLFIIPPQRYEGEDLADPRVDKEFQLHDGEEESVDHSLLEQLIILTDRKPNVGFEFCALEALLVEEVKSLKESFVPIKSAANGIIHAISKSPGSTKKLRQISEVRRRLNSFEEKCKGCRTAIKEVLDNDEDVRRLEISRFWEDPDAWDSPSDSPASEDAEILLECYDQEIESLVKQLKSLDENLDDALQLMELHLAGVRNTLIKSELGLELIGVAIASIGAVAGVFGMNIPNGWEEKTAVFWPMARGFTFFSIAAILLTVWLFRRVKL